MKDCFKPNPVTTREIVFRKYRFKFLKCVGNYRDLAWQETFQLYEFWKKTGQNPFTGSFSDIPDKTLEIFYMIDSLVTEHQKRNSRGK